MTKIALLEPRFVDAVPSTLEDGVIYVSIVFNTVVHRCCCGCGNRVVTPLSPADWRLEYDGRAVTLYPSIGNHQYPCRSHYWIRKNRVQWSYEYTSSEIEATRAATQLARVEFYDGPRENCPVIDQPKGAETPRVGSWWGRFRSRGRDGGRGMG